MNQTNQTMRVLALSVLAFFSITPLFSQEDCNVFNIQQLAADYLSIGVDTVILQPDGSFEAQLSNGTTASFTLGCTDPAYVEYDATANTDDGSCATLVVNGCTDPAYVEYDATANTDDGSCATLAWCASPTMDGYSYSVVEIGDQCWFAENLRTTVYADDSAIPEVTNDYDWSQLFTGARCDLNNDVTNVATYGRLYNWYAATDAAGLCPSGWHVPTDGEWTDLKNYISSQGFSGTEGTALKTTSGWGFGNGTDDFGFSALPGGDRSFDGSGFLQPGGAGFWWSSSPSGGNAWSRGLNNLSSAFYRSIYYPQFGYSVRCLRDAEGCTDPAYMEYDSAANTDDGSCATLIVNGCMDPAYMEYDSAANTDDGSCATLASTGCAPVSMDGHTYSVVVIGDQCWFAENLRTTVYADDSAIPEVTDNGAWTELSTGARCDYENDAANVATYGRLYNWYAATDAAGLCPSGWHVPTDGEWTDLENYISSQGFSGTEGTALKATSGWSSGGNGTDDFGFSALPGGVRYSFNGLFDLAGDIGYWWSSSPSGGSAWYRVLYYYDPVIGRYNFDPRFGFSVRCLRDAD